MRFVALAGGLALTLALAGCDNEQEETPDIVEAIPVDDAADDGVAGDNGDESDAGAGQGQASGASSGAAQRSSTPARPQTGAQSGARPSAPPSTPHDAHEGTHEGTMESGSNADGGREIDPARTKLVPAD